MTTDIDNQQKSKLLQSASEGALLVSQNLHENEKPTADELMAGRSGAYKIINAINQIFGKKKGGAQ